MAILSAARVLVVGVGGVGGYAAEMLARSGVGHITIIDADEVGVTNLNRQIIALTSTLGHPKVEVMKQRIAEINPTCSVDAVSEYLDVDNVSGLLDTGNFDFVADCIDTIAPKVALLDECVRRRLKVVSSMGAGGRIDPSAVRYADLWETSQDGLARAVRERFKKMGRKPRIRVVWSNEAPRKASLVEENLMPGKRTSFGTLATVPSVFGIYIASYIINALLKK